MITMDAPSAPPLNTFRPGTAGVAKTEVELSISGRNLLDLDTFSKSDPMCVVYSKDSEQGGDTWIEIGRTECIDNNLNPELATKINVEFTFEQQQLMRFEVYDMDSDLRDHDFIGSAECSLGQIVASGGDKGSNGHVLKLINSNNSKLICGDLIVKAEELTDCKDEVEIKLGVNLTLPDKSFFHPSMSTFFILIAPMTILFSFYLGIILFVSALLTRLISKPSGTFLTISRANEAKDIHKNMNVVYRTEVNKTGPGKQSFEAIVIPIKTLCNGDIKRPIKIECFQYRRNGSHALLGEMLTTTEMLLERTKMNSTKQTFTKLMSPICELEVISCDIMKKYSFLDYIQGGTELACTVAIDFTASNGDPFSPDSLHHISSYGK